MRMLLKRAEREKSSCKYEFASGITTSSVVLKKEKCFVDELKQDIERAVCQSEYLCVWGRLELINQPAHMTVWH